MNLALRRLFVAFVFLALLLSLAMAVVGWVGSERAMQPARRSPSYALTDFPFANTTERVEFRSRDGAPLVGWFIPSWLPRAPTIVLLHGYGSSRAQMLPHAAYLQSEGYNVFVFDFRHHGESGGDAVTLGLREPADIDAAITYVFSRSDVDRTRLALQGVSLGASAAIIEAATDPRVAAIVSEGAFTDLRATIDQSFERYVNLPPVFGPVTTLITEQRLGGRADDVRPIDAIAKLGSRPVFIIDGAEDRVIPPGSGQKLADAATGPKEFWLIEGAEHGGGWKADPAEYRGRVLAFYRRHLPIGR